MKIILILYVCSYVGSSCLPGYQWPNKFDDMYDCMQTGYSESMKKIEEFESTQKNQDLAKYAKMICKNTTQREITQIQEIYLEKIDKNYLNSK